MSRGLGLLAKSPSFELTDKPDLPSPLGKTRHHQHHQHQHQWSPGSRGKGGSVGVGVGVGVHDGPDLPDVAKPRVHWSISPSVGIASPDTDHHHHHHPDITRPRVHWSPSPNTDPSLMPLQVPKSVPLSSPSPNTDPNSHLLMPLQVPKSVPLSSPSQLVREPHPTAAAAAAAARSPRSPSHRAALGAGVGVGRPHHDLHHQPDVTKRNPQNKHTPTTTTSR